MPTQTITYGNKIGTLPKKTHINQWWDDDANEVKNVVNNNASELSLTNTNVSTNSSNIETLNTDLTNLGLRVDAVERGYQGVLLIADTPSSDGYYLAGESGTYTNAGNLVVDLNNGVSIISVTGTQTVFQLIEIPVSEGGGAEEWEAKAYIKDSFVFYQGYLYKSTFLTETTDIPSFSSSIWKPMDLNGNTISTINPIDIENVKRGFTLDGSGNEVADATRFITNYIPLNTETIYMFHADFGTFVLNVSEYDSGFNLLSTGIKFNNISTVNANTAYFRVGLVMSEYLSSTKQAFINKIYGSETGTKPTNWISFDLSFESVYKNDNLLNEIDGDNLFDYETMVNASSNESSFIDVVAEEYYVKNNVLGVDWYDVTETLISSSSTGLNVKAPVNAVKCKLKFININAGLFSDIYFKKGYAINENHLSKQFKQNKIGSDVKPITELDWCHIGDSISIDRGDGTNYPFYVQKNINFRNFKNTALSGRAMGDFAEGDTYYKVTPTDDIVTIALGTNDQGFNIALGSFGDTTNASFYGKMHLLYNRIRTTSPQAVIAFLTLIRRDNGTNALGLTVKDYRDAIIDFCEQSAIKYLDIYNQSGIDPNDATNKATWITDGTHPESVAHEKLLSPLVTEFIKSLIY